MPKFQVAARTTSGLPHRLVVSTSVSLSSPVYGLLSTPISGVIKVESPELTAGKYYWGIEQDGVLLAEPRGESRVGAASHTICWATCSDTDSNHVVFSQIQAEDPDCFLHLGDLHYLNLTTSIQSQHVDGYDRQMLQPNFANLFKNVPVAHMADDHDGGGGNDHAGNTATALAAAAAWRTRVPHPPLVLNESQDPRYYYFDIGRVRYIVTDLRTVADPRGIPDDANKSMMGATQKAWFKDLIANSPGMYLVWCSTRIFHAVPQATADGWGGFSTERTELCDHIRTHASGRVLVLTGDRHQAGIDDGTNCNYATLGDPLPCGMAAPLDKSINAGGNATFSSGVFSNIGQYGKLQITDGGGATITVDISVHDSTGTTLASLQLTPTL